MDGIITPEQLQALEAQAAQQQVNLNQASIRPSLERDAALVAEYARKSSQQVRKPSSISEFFFKGPVVPIEERLGYAREAARLQGDIQRRIQEAGLMQGPVQQTQAEQVAPKSSPEQPKSEAPAQPSANATAPSQEQKQPDQFSEFSRFIKQREEARAKAVNYIKSNFSREYWLDGLELANKMTDEYFAPPRNIAQPIIDQFTGKPLEGYALIGGKVEKIDSQKKQAALTQEQSQSLQFGRAMESSSKRLSELMGKTGYNPASAIERLPALEMFKGEPRKLYENIVTDFALAYNRKTSGASITPREFEVVEKLFFPAIGDTPEVIKAKEQNRKREIESLFQAVPEWARTSSEQQQQQSAPGGVVEFMRAPGKGGIIKK